MKRFKIYGMAALVLAATAVAGIAFTDDATHPTQPNAAGDAVADNQPVATVGGHTIRQGDLVSAVAGDLEKLRLEQHRVLDSGLDRLIDMRLLELEAERRDMTVEALLAAEIESKVTVADSEVDEFYSRHQEQIKRPKEEVAAQLKQHLQQQKASSVRTRLVADLRQKYPVNKLLEPMRLNIPVAGAPARGGQDAGVTIMAFSDFQCPYCKSIESAFDEVLEAYGDRVQLVFRQFPLRSIHPQAQKAAEASLCAGEQDRFWDMHAAIFERSKELSVEQLKQRAHTLGLDTDRFDSCLDNGEQAAAVDADMAVGARAGVSSTPSIFVNGRAVHLVRGSTPFQQISKLVDDELARQSHTEH